MNLIIQYWPQYLMFCFYVGSIVYYVILGLYYGGIKRSIIIDLILMGFFIFTLHHGGFFNNVGF